MPKKTASENLEMSSKWLMTLELVLMNETITVF